MGSANGTMAAPLAQTGRRYLGIGELLVSDEELIVSTVLGSCVSILLHHPRSRLSGICHSQLAERHGEGFDCRDACPHPCGREFDSDNDYRYLSCAAARLMADFDGRGIPRSELRVSLFGGGDMVGVNVFRIGERNVKKAHKIISDWGLRIAEEDTGGRTSRRLSLDMRTGKCTVALGPAPGSG
ncbi:MAG TPA: chemotaxis protein CheD [Rectinemataceae bacterium]|nr:chemotaxis protein CheD [Rectinemataceae bacterium]